MGYVNEPYFLPRSAETTPDAEDDGLLFFVSTDGVRGAADFVILEAKTMEEIETVHLPIHTAFLAHGQFVPNVGQAVREAMMSEEHPDIAAIVDQFVTI